jgi:signal transduction histidine kinase
LSLGFVVLMDHRLATEGRADLRLAALDGGIVVVVAMISAATVGAVLAARRPDHPVGWLLLLLGVEMALGAAAISYATWGAVVRPGSLPAADVVGTLADSSWIAWFVILALVLHLTPTGRPVSRRWEAVAWATVASGLLWWSGVLTHHRLDPPLGDAPNPLELHSGARLLSVVTHAAGWCTAFGVILAAASLVLRFNRSRGGERRQLLWLAVAAVPLPVFVVGAFVGAAFDKPVAVAAATGGMVTLVPLATALAAGRYHLYDVDRILSRATTYLLVTGLLAAAYAVVVLASGRVFGDLTGASTVPAVAGTLAAVAVAAPAHRVVQNALDRHFRRRRYDAVRMAREFARSPSPSTDVDTTFRQAVGEPHARLGYWLHSRDCWVTADGHPMDPRPTDLVIERHRRPVARLRLAEAADRELATAVAGELVSELDNARLRAELATQLLEVQQSRQRLATAQLVERRRIGRDLHDGAQQRLLALGLQLRAAHDTDDHRELRHALEYGIAEVQTAVHELRDLANGLHPSVLTDSGLFAALDELSARSVLPIHVTGEERRFPPETETTAWFIACEAITNAFKHAGASHIDVTVTVVGPRVHLSIDDDGIGRADMGGRGLRGLIDRAEAIGGSVQASTSAEGGTSVRADLPCASS